MVPPDLYSLEALLDGTGMARIPAGEFLMGADADMDDAKPAHRVRITQEFYMTKCEVSQAQWKTVMTDPHAKPDAKGAAPADAVSTDPSHFKGASLPVESVSWDDVQVFLRRLNARDTAQRYRLPSEAEWEYACKAGKASGDFTNLDGKAWYKPNSEGHTQPVGQKQPNAWGLYDMFGNVSEWVQDWYSPNYYSQSPAANPTGPDSGS
ncbi:MAG: formylglycine-generating enzyme family protein, partial [Acidobacteriota bacterium]|nr:formylglycine-generating enzyme family protein [Acidobacteriota bacterium]